MESDDRGGGRVTSLEHCTADEGGILKVLVTGGAGFIGSHVAEAYARRGDEVTIVDNLSTGRRSNIPQGVEFLELDVRDGATAKLIRDRRFDLINHHAAQIDVRHSVADPRADASINIDGLLNVVEAARAADVGRFVFVSSGGVVYGEPELRPTPETAPKAPLSPYGVTKLTGEQYLHYYHRIHGLEYVALRYANVYGPRQDPRGEAGVIAIFSERIGRGESLTVFGDGEQTRDYIDVRSVVSANLVAGSADLPPAERLDDRGFNVGTGVETSVVGLARLLEAASGRETRLVHAEARAGELRHSSLDAGKLRKLGWAPVTSIEDGIRETYEWIVATTEALG